MWTSRPATRSTFAASDIRAESYEVHRPSFFLFHKSEPADPFIAGEGSEGFPDVVYVFMRVQYGA
jgi:hypothetical protein